MAASKPISWSFMLNTSLVSLNNNFGTLTLVLGCFPLDIQPYRTMSDCSIPHLTKKVNFFCYLSSLPFRVQILTDKVFTTPRCVQIYHIFKWYNCLRSQFCTCYDVTQTLLTSYMFVIFIWVIILLYYIYLVLCLLFRHIILSYVCLNYLLI
jgi:hypothetical protein